MRAYPARLHPRFGFGLPRCTTSEEARGVPFPRFRKAGKTALCSLLLPFQIGGFTGILRFGFKRGFKFGGPVGASCFMLSARDSNHNRKPRRGFHRPVQKLVDSSICADPPRGANACESHHVRRSSRHSALRGCCLIWQQPLFHIMLTSAGRGILPSGLQIWWRTFRP